MRLSVFDLVPRSPRAPADRGVARAAGPRALPLRFGGDGTGLGVDLGEAHELLRRARELGRRPRVGHRGQPLLQPPRPAPGLLPALRRLPPAPRPAGRGRPAGGGHRRARPRPSRRHDRRPPALSYLQQWLPHAAQALVRSGGAAAVGLRAHGAQLPAPAPRRAGRPPLGTAADLPDTQRLHHGPPPGPGLGLLPLRPVLQGPARARRAGGGQAAGGRSPPGCRRDTPCRRPVDVPRARAVRPAARAPAPRWPRWPTCSSPTAVQALPADRADEVLAAADVLLGHWGCAVLDERVPGPGAAAADARLRGGDRARHRHPGGLRPRAARHLGRGRQRGAGGRVHGGGHPVGQQGAPSPSASGCGARSLPPLPRRHPVGNWAKRIGLVGRLARGPGRGRAAAALPLRGGGRRPVPDRRGRRRPRRRPGGARRAAGHERRRQPARPGPARDRADDRRRRAGPHDGRRHADQHRPRRAGRPRRPGRRAAQPGG